MTQTATKTKTERMARTFRTIHASADGDKLPTKIELLKTGMWDTPNHGMFMVTAEDLVEYKANFDMGIAQAGDSGIMIDYEHNKGIAAGWIKGLSIGVDAEGISTLFADPVEWTGAGKKDLMEKNYKCISPEFYPSSRGGWEDPEEYGHFVANVLVAAGLVNRPLFKGLQPIMASEDSNESREDKNIIYISASEKEKNSMTLEEVKAKELSALTEEEKSFLVEHKAELSAEEQTKFGMEVAETAEAKAEREAEEKRVADELEAKRVADEAAAEEAKASAPDLTNAQPVMASAVKGDETKVVMAGSEVKALYDKAMKLDRKEAEDFMKDQIARGAVKADQINDNVDMLIAASGVQRTQLETMFKNLPSNEAVAADEKGSSASGDAKSAVEQIKEKANAIMASALADKKPMDIGTAMSQVLRENPELAKYQNEILEGKA